MLALVSVLAPSPTPNLVYQSLDLVFGWGWIVVVVLLLWIIWQTYRTLRMVAYVSAIEWTYFQITLPEDIPQTPKAMENVFEVLAGMHKSPDLGELYFEGYLEFWYSCEIRCRRGSAQYLMVVPTIHRQFVEGVIYGQYPSAEIKEVPDYTQHYSWRNIDKTFDFFGTEFVLTEDDIYPIKTYLEYEDVLAEDDRFVDPHQVLVEAYTNVADDEEYWVQILIRPLSPAVVAKWAAKAEAVIDKMSGKEDEKKLGMFGQIYQGVLSLPRELFHAFAVGPLESADGGKKSQSFKFPIVSPSEQEKMKGILSKTSRGAFKTKIRIMYLAPLGKLHKPNIGKTIGAFKQFNTYNLNSFKPDNTTKTNKPEYFLREYRRYQRKRRMFLNYQWRDFWGVDSGFYLSAAELATIYHFPVKYAKAPAIERAQAGRGGAPDNVPFV